MQYLIIQYAFYSFLFLLYTNKEKSNYFRFDSSILKPQNEHSYDPNIGLDIVVDIVNKYWQLRSGRTT